eukprot:NODE_4693_length_1859_cov_5.242494.p1 GENE.NODE_4693_length_1859_cov_5.242494~~NODE_4693_length_1859_cov_5.242494.p1  ORF type:complete len:470 (+),score=118.36 NODE_4693_length_1859_cov_5.242494:101-1510(+)
MAANPKQFVNAEDTAVQEATVGTAIASGLSLLDGFPEIKVLVNSSWAKDKVALVSGGGSGHEPMHTGFLAEGMLTAAVIGDVFASPSVTAVLAAIVHVTGPAGCLLVIKNYTGDRLNFTIAAQKARSLFGLKVETVIVDDDVATGARRGLAGTILVHKLAGAVAQEGAPLEAVKATAEGAIASMATLGVSFSTVCRRLPERMDVDQMEVGLGIHGEPGASVEARKTCREIVHMMAHRLLASERITGHSGGFVALVNNLGGVPHIEMSIIMKELMESAAGKHIKAIVGPAALCTSLDMNGISITLLALKGNMLDLLGVRNNAAAWPGIVVIQPLATPPMPFKPEDISYLAKATPSKDVRIAAFLTTACQVLVDSKDELNEIDAVVGDADTGSTLARAGQRILDHMEALPVAQPEAAETGAEATKTMPARAGRSENVPMETLAGTPDPGAVAAAKICAALARVAAVVPATA